MKAPIIEINTGCLLVVDDQESNIQVVGAALGKLGFEILPATGGAQAFQRLGCAVTLLHKNAHLLDREDMDAAALVQKAFGG